MRVVKADDDIIRELEHNKISKEMIHFFKTSSPEQNTLVLNNYSYYLSQRGEELIRAKKMITKCLELTSGEPNASYIDTYAWVLYKLGEYELAREQIEQAILLKNNSPVILDHCGDILYKMGLEKEAVTYWERASKLDSKNLELIEKINKQSTND